MSDAIERGLAFLISQQHLSGFWQEWEMPVGPSRMWTTAYVGWRLASHGRAPVSILRQAADWLEASELEGGGWGYAESTGADADSTALGILFLHALGRPAPPTAVRRLLGFARDDGGFGTYGFEQSFGGWTASQAEVTATAALALQTAGVSPDAIERAATFLRRRRRADGLWDSYWWTSPFYATELSVRLLGERARQEACGALSRIRPQNAFEGALRSLVLGGDEADLTLAQVSDGSWPTAPILRLTHRDLYTVEARADAGPCFADLRRVFTTATVVSALGGESNVAKYSSDLDRRDCGGTI